MWWDETLKENSKPTFQCQSVYASFFYSRNLLKQIFVALQKTGFVIKLIYYLDCNISCWTRSNISYKYWELVLSNALLPILLLFRKAILSIRYIQRTLTVEGSNINYIYWELIITYALLPIFLLLSKALFSHRFIPRTLTVGETASPSFTRMDSTA